MKGPFVVVAPLSTLQHWKRTVEEWSTLNCVLYYDLKGIDGRKACRAYEWFYTDISIKGSVLQTAEICKFHILITSYEVFLQDVNNVLINLPFQHIVIDEAHRLKNQNAKILNALKKLPCKRISLLTGTPIQNNTTELWSLLNFIEPSHFNSLTTFLTQFGDLSKLDQVEKLHVMLKPYLLRRMKEDVESSIPPLQETIIDIEMTTIQKTIYRALYEKNKGILVKSGGINLTTSLNNLEMQLRKCCNHPFLMKEIMAELTKDAIHVSDYMAKMIQSSGKMILLEKLIIKMRSEGNKILIFSQFTMMLDLLEEWIKFLNVKYEKIDGSIKAKERQNAIDRFNDPKKKREVFLLSTKAGGLGINLTSANVVVIFDSDWNPQNDVQATARAHRIGQSQEVQVYRLITTRTYEAEMFERASKKLGLDQAIFMGGAFQHTKDDPLAEEDNLKKLNKNEIETLLKKGIMGLIEDQEGEGAGKQAHQDIEEILENARIAKYSLINGTYTFSKSTFVAKGTDVELNVNDPNFWDIVFQNSESPTKKLVDSYETKYKADGFKCPDAQKQIMVEMCDLVSKLIETKKKMEGYSADDEANLDGVLTRISTNKHFHKHYKDIALQMAAEIKKPSRRAKKITPAD